MFTNTSRRFARTNDYRLGERLLTRPRTKERIRVVRPAAKSEITAALEARRERVVRSGFSSAA